MFSSANKVNIFEDIDKGVTRADICKKYEIVTLTLCGIVKVRENIYDPLAAGNFVPKLRKIRVAKYEDVEICFSDGLKQCVKY